MGLLRPPEGTVSIVSTVTFISLFVVNFKKIGLTFRNVAGAPDLSHCMNNYWIEIVLDTPNLNTVEVEPILKKKIDFKN